LHLYNNFVTNDIFYLDVENVSNIKIIGNEKLTFQQLLLGYFKDQTYFKEDIVRR